MNRNTFPNCAGLEMLQSLVTTNQIEVGRIQARQFAALIKQGNILYIEGPSSGGGVSALRTKGMMSAKLAGLQLKMIKGDWTERSGHHAIKSWPSPLSTSRKLDIRLVGCQNDAMAMGARKAFGELAGAQEREHWLKVPFTGCDGVTQDGPGVGPSRTVNRDGGVAADCGPSSGNIGQDDPNRFRPA